MRFLLPLLIIIALSVMASAGSDIVGPFGSQKGILGFSGKTPIVGRVGSGSGGGGGGGCAGVIDASIGCPLPMLGM